MKILRKLRLKEISFVDKGANPGARVCFMKRAKPAQKKENKMAEVKKEGLAGLVELEALGLDDEQKKAVLMIIEAAAASGKAGLPEPEKKPEPPKPEVKPEEKPMEEKKASAEQAEVAKRLADSEAQRVELEKRLVALEDEKQHAEFTKRAESRGFVPMSTEEQVSVLKAASKLPEETKAQIEAMLDKVNKAMEAAPVLKRVGVVGKSENEQGLESIAKRIQKEAADKGVKLSYAVAYRDACKQNPGLFVQESE